MDEKTLSYLASQIDSGSYIGIAPLQKVKYSPQVQVRRSEMKIIDTFVKNFPGYYGMKDGKCWVMYQGKKAIALLRAVYPYLKVKRAHAEIIFEYADHVERYKANASRMNKPLNAEEIAVREELKLKLQQLNQGKDADPAPEPIPSIFD